jgi:hypothetical protein
VGVDSARHTIKTYIFFFSPGASFGRIAKMSLSYINYDTRRIVMPLLC